MLPIAWCESPRQKLVGSDKVDSTFSGGIEKLHPIMINEGSHHLVRSVDIYRHPGRIGSNDAIILWGDDGHRRYSVLRSGAVLKMEGRGIQADYVALPVLELGLDCFFACALGEQEVNIQLTLGGLLPKSPRFKRKYS